MKRLLTSLAISVILLAMPAVASGTSFYWEDTLPGYVDTNCWSGSTRMATFYQQEDGGGMRTRICSNTDAYPFVVPEHKGSVRINRIPDGCELRIFQQEGYAPTGYYWWARGTGFYVPSDGFKYTDSAKFVC